MSAEDEPSTWPPCAHHWVVASPQPGLPALPAHCKKCGWTRGFDPHGGQPATLTYGEYLAGKHLSIV